VPPVKTPFTLDGYIPKGFFGSDSLDDDPEEREVAQCCMVSWADVTPGIFIPLSQANSAILYRSFISL